MQKKIVMTVAVALLLAGVASVSRSSGQETAKNESEAQLKSADTYKVEFAVNETENGKKINSRSYLMLLRAEALPKWSERQHLRVGSRVPYSYEAGKYNYQDVGMNIDCTLMPMGNGNVSIDTNLEYSSMVVEEGANRDPQHPVFRQVRSQVEAVVAPNKPTVIAEMDDVASTHHYVFEAKVTKVTP